MPAEIGRGAAGFTDIVTRSGKSGFHGSMFEFVRNSAFDARNYFDHPSIAELTRIPPFRRNEFGFTNGGPGSYLPHLYDGRGKTYYFAQYQGFRQVLGTTQVLAVPTVAERAGYDNVTYPDDSTDTLMVPVNPQIAAVLARYPLPNNPSGAFAARTYAVPSKVATDADQFSIRIDQKIRREKVSVPGALQLRQPHRTHHQPRPDHHRLQLRILVRRPAAQRRLHIHAHCFSPLFLGLIIQHHARHAIVSHSQPH